MVANRIMCRKHWSDWYIYVHMFGLYSRLWELLNRNKYLVANLWGQKPDKFIGVYGNIEKGFLKTFKCLSWFQLMRETIS
jgi:hypothetical protein